jgi:CDP-6-deoxy-D-xylo-4-hexulose-3-dehydrase
MRGLVVGASGLVGAELVRVLDLHGVGTVGTHFSRNAPGPYLDVRDAGAVSECLSREKPDVVFLPTNLAGGADYCETHEEEARALFVDGTRNVLEAAETQHAKVVFFSSDYIFDGTSGPYDESASPSPVSVYGQVKVEAEALVRRASDDHLIIRTTVVYGWNPTSRDFAMQVWRKLNSGEAMRVPDDQDGTPTLADNLAEVTLRLVQDGASGVFNVAGRDRLSRAEFGRRLARTFALDPALIEPVATAELGQVSKRPLQAGLTTDKLHKHLGTEAMALDEALKRLRRHWRAATHTSYTPTAQSSEATALRNEILDQVRRYHELAHGRRPFEPFKSLVPYAGRVFDAEELVNLTESSLDFWLTLGPNGDAFEHRMRQLFGSRDFLMVNSGSSANLVAVSSLRSPTLERPLEPGDEVITPAVTFPTTLAPIIQNGLIPVFVDCEVGTYNINPSLIEAAISEKTRAIFVPHTLGNPCDMDVICDVVQRHGLYLIEDTCDALGSTFRGKLVGTFGDLATLSFYPAHHMTTGEGGGVIVNGAGFSRIARSIRDWGRDCWCAAGESNTCGKRFGWQQGCLPLGYDHKYTYSHIGYNLKPTDMQAAIGLAQVEKLEGFIERRKYNFRRLYEGLSRLQEFLILPFLEPRSDPSWFSFPVTVREGISCRALQTHLEDSNIETRQLFGGNILSQPGYLDIPHRVAGGLEGSDTILRDTLFVGVYPGLDDEMIDFIIERFEAFFRSSDPR